MRTVSSQDYFRIKPNTRDGIYYSAGIPSTHWGPLMEKPGPFSRVTTETIRIDPKTQAEFYQDMQEGTYFTEPYLILMTAPTETRLLEHGYDLMKRAVARRTRLQITEAATINEEKTTGETLYMLINVHDDATEERVHSIRDWCTRHRDHCRIVCVVGSPSVILNKLRLDFDAIISIQDTSERNFA